MSNREIIYFVCMAVFFITSNVTVYLWRKSTERWNDLCQDLENELKEVRHKYFEEYIMMTEEYRKLCNDYEALLKDADTDDRR